MFDIAKKKAFVCDLDGTLFMGPNPIKPAVDFVIESTNSGRFKFFYLTNNTSKCPEEYMKKIAGAAIPVTPAQILTPLITLESYIREKGYRSVYLIASEKVKAHMAERLADTEVSLDYDPEANELIALTYDRELTYDKLAKATSLWNMRNVPPNAMCPIRTANQEPVDFVATHPDMCCPSERGPIPDIGGMMKFLELTNGMKPSHVFGKPSPTLLAPVLDEFRPEEIAVVGDRLYTDKAIADNAGVDFVCVLSGETTPEDLAKYKGTPPAIVVDTFDLVAASGR
ncbi:MAG: HAD hydrolase-like protein [Kiritimatiellae bacterium]|nr:HAD hydrolase-like protein [Kiritimatiellia bacterium]